MGPQLIRAPGWESRLIAEIERTRLQPFEWRKNDCCAFVCRCVQAITGQDFFAGFEYRSGMSALRLLAREGGILSICSRFLPEGNPPFARRGDVVMTARTSIGICTGKYAMVPGEFGLIPIRRSAWLRAWRVGE